jgi:predicted O-methyltransferase YrrM
MARAGTGVLYSIDMPRNGVADPHAYTGQAVPQDLRDDWHLVFGPSRKVLPRLLREVEMIDVFLHDADHAYRAQMEEYHTVWPFLRSGGFLISDDVDNSAFIEFAATTRAASWLLPRPAFGDAVGVLRK